MLFQTCLADSGNVSVKVGISRAIQVSNNDSVRSNVPVLKQLDSVFVTFVTP